MSNEEKEPIDQAAINDKARQLADLLKKKTDIGFPLNHDNRQRLMVIDETITIALRYAEKIK